MQVKQILTDAIYKSLQDRKFEPVIDPVYLLFGLQEINKVLDGWRDKIPYYSQATFNNVENLHNTKFVSVFTLNYVIGQNVSNVVCEKSLIKFRELKQILDLSGFTSIYYFDELSQTIEVYPLPSAAPYSFIVEGKISQINLGMDDAIPANMPQFMVDAVTYELAFRFCGEFGAYWSPEKESQRQALVKGLEDKESMDLTPDRDIVFGNPSRLGVPPFPYLYYLSGGGGSNRWGWF